MADIKEFHAAINRISIDSVTIKDFLKKEFTSLEMIGYEMDELRRKRREALAELEGTKQATLTIKEQNDKLIEDAKVKAKAIEDNMFKKRSELQAECMILQSEVEVLRADRYKLMRDTIGQEVIKKAK